MRRVLVACTLAAVACVSLLFSQGPPGAAKGPDPCDRACLEGFVNLYLDALIAHNVFGLPLASRVRFTENAQVLDLGDGLWNVTTGIGKYKLIVADPQSQQVGFLGTVLANDRPTTLALRLKLENRKISEIETLVTISNPPPAAGKGAAKGPPPALTGAVALDAMALDPVFTQAVPEGGRGTREQLIAAANAYYDGLERGDTNLVQFDAQCNRIENGVQTTNNPTPGRSGGIDPRALSCADQISSRVLANYQVVYPRRTPVIDEERQIVFGFFMYQQAGDLLEVASPGHGVYKFPEANWQPAFVEVAQAFKLIGGQIRRMEALSTTVPYGTPRSILPR